MRETDWEWSQRYCSNRGLRYLSHETYVTMTTHEVWIAVEDWSGRYELRLRR
jgi:hypothetical protein